MLFGIKDGLTTIVSPSSVGRYTPAAIEEEWDDDDDDLAIEQTLTEIIVQAIVELSIILIDNLMLRVHPCPTLGWQYPLQESGEVYYLSIESTDSPWYILNTVSLLCPEEEALVDVEEADCASPVPLIILTPITFKMLLM
ncbi:MAG: hypothetical protein WBB28_01500 [Crinalium sp.]